MIRFVVRLRGEAGVDVAEDDEGAGAHAQGGHGPAPGHQQVAPRWDSEIDYLTVLWIPINQC
jgi:hypothetical protein